VVIAARNEEANLPELLERLVDQDYHHGMFEVIMVDDGSQDQTPEIAGSFAAKSDLVKLIRIDQVPPGWAPKKWALTKGIEVARGDIILVTDADCLPGPQWIRSMVEPFSDPTVGLVAGPAPLIYEQRTFWREALFVDSCALDALAAAGMSRNLALMAVGRNFGYYKALFHEVGGFSGIEGFLSGDDDLLMHRIIASGQWRIKFVICSDAVVPSPPVSSFRAFVYQRLRFASLGRHYFSLPTGAWFKIVLPLIYIANLAALIGLIAAVVTLRGFWLTPLAVKIAAEGALVLFYIKKIDEKVRITTFLMVGILYPFYVSVFGTLGSFVKLSWKGRRFGGAKVSG
jgi:cellulose synthase/poly-beta-1,6-N-acetylglucosamine synthase-like glycosyltransferase